MATNPMCSEHEAGVGEHGKKSRGFVSQNANREITVIGLRGVASHFYFSGFSFDFDMYLFILYIGVKVAQLETRTAVRQTRQQATSNIF
jgi:hypothetical protein